MGVSWVGLTSSGRPAEGPAPPQGVSCCPWRGPWPELEGGLQEASDLGARQARPGAPVTWLQGTDPCNSGDPADQHLCHPGAEHLAEMMGGRCFKLPHLCRCLAA